MLLLKKKKKHGLAQGRLFYNNEYLDPHLPLDYFSTVSNCFGSGFSVATNVCLYHEVVWFVLLCLEVQFDGSFGLDILVFFFCLELCVGFDRTFVFPVCVFTRHLFVGCR
jgi:hypothetical protein